MRVRRIQIHSWRHFDKVQLELAEDTGLVCLVGANGTGKTHLLELIAACAERLGLAQGQEIPRGNPFSDPHHFLLDFFLAPNVSEPVEAEAAKAGVEGWNRTLTIESKNAGNKASVVITAGGLHGGDSTTFAARIIAALKVSKSVHFLSLDADRAYPKRNFGIHEVAQAYETDWGSDEYTRGRSFRASTTLYDEWIKYFLARENQSGTDLIRQIRLARKAGEPAPEFLDHFATYTNSLLKVLPHLNFTGVDQKNRTLLFDTTGLPLNFNQLSGGEREIAFLVGQIDRFGLRHGVFLLDEPELHLNADLIRAWVAYLTSTVTTGQIWLATHSLEAVEAAGQASTFVLERNETTRTVDQITRLDSRPVLSALSRSVGTPAFSISQLAFVFVEGEEAVGERERFRRLSGGKGHLRFIESSSGKEVQRRLLYTRSLAKESGQHMRLGAVVDRDFMQDAEAKVLMADGVFVLPVHEIENLFLRPEVLAEVFKVTGVAKVPIDVLREAADRRAGNWIFQYAMATPNAKTLPDLAIAAKDRAKSTSWDAFDEDQKAAIAQVVSLSGYDEDGKKKLGSLLEVAIRAYSKASNRQCPMDQMRRKTSTI
jgi:predicted ATPase